MFAQIPISTRNMEESLTSIRNMEDYKLTRIDNIRAGNSCLTR